MKDDIVASLFIRISRIRDEVQTIDEIVAQKELVFIALLGLPTSWNASASGINSWKDTLTFKQMWNACSQEAKMSLVSTKKDNEEENISNASSAHHKKKGTFKKYKDQRRK